VSQVTHRCYKRQKWCMLQGSKLGWQIETQKDHKNPVEAMPATSQPSY